MADITISINDVLGKLHDHAIAEIKKKGMDSNWWGRNLPNFVGRDGTTILNTGISEGKGDKPSQFTGDTTGKLYLRVIVEKKLGNTKDADKINEMLSEYIKLWSGMKTVNVTTDIKHGSKSAAGLDGDEKITWYQVEYKMDLEKIPYKAPTMISTGGKPGTEKDPHRSATSTPTGTGSSGGSSDNRGLTGKSQVSILGASNNLSLAEMYREAKLISENSFFESKPFVEKSEKSNLVVEFLK